MLTSFKRIPSLLQMITMPFSITSAQNLNQNGAQSLTIGKMKRKGLPALPQKICSIPLTTPIFPNYNPRTVQLNELQQRVILYVTKFYKKYSPNYITAIIYKTVDQALKKSLPPKDLFCRIGTYCKVTFNKNAMTLTSLYRVNIEDVQKLEIKEDAFVPSEMLPIPAPEQELNTTVPTVAPERRNKILELLMKSQAKNVKLQKQVNDFYASRVSRLVEPPFILNIELEAKLRFLVGTYFKLFNREIVANSVNLLDAAAIVDSIAAELCERQYVSTDDFQQLIESIDIHQRIDKLQDILNRSCMFSAYLNDLEKIVQDKFRQKKFAQYYTEIWKLAKQTIDGKQAKELFMENATKAFMEKNPSEDIKTVFNGEIERYSQMDENSSESTMAKTYIEELSKIPYDVKSIDIYDMQRAHEALEAEHYGMKQVKDEILELISVGKLRGTLKGKIICLVGGPGLGKTTLAASIAKALNRKFANISLGGVSDSSALKGHRRTYIGAYSGKIIGALKQCGTNNPVILLDQIDKMGRSPQGDPSSELLEILDPAQNSSFTDNYVDVSVDLSNVLFVCSANYIGKISKPLQDRLVKIYLTSYTNNQKKQIYNRHILRKGVQDVGLSTDKFVIDPEVVDMLIHDYSMGEPGVRELEKITKKLLEKIVLKIVEQTQTLPIHVTKDNIVSYLGQPKRTKRDHTKIRQGVAIGLGDSHHGGRLTYIEAVKRSYAPLESHQRNVLVTGSLGTVIKQAMDISYTFAQSFLREKLNNNFLYQNAVHIHAPEGASKKDGPNDSITIVTALISLATGKLVKKGVAMTGQLSLKGKVLKVIDAKEKVLIAKREGIREVILPKSNQHEIDILTDDIKQSMIFHFVEEYDDVYKIVF